MADQTGISWADMTFNPWIGCAKAALALGFRRIGKDRAGRLLDGVTHDARPEA